MTAFFCFFFRFLLAQRQLQIDHRLTPTRPPMSPSGWKSSGPQIDHERAKGHSNINPHRPQIGRTSTPHRRQTDLTSTPHQAQNRPHIDPASDPKSTTDRRQSADRQTWEVPAPVILGHIHPVATRSQAGFPRYSGRDTPFRNDVGLGCTFSRGFPGASALRRLFLTAFFCFFF